ncbi:MAG TPA: homoserine dehydrogenase [Gemmatimonadaceae bacterium]|nr:homoserine dehydrogenase [Gemmatimonadaceae bacterium]
MTPQQLEIEPAPALHEFHIIPPGSTRHNRTPRFARHERPIAESPASPRTIRIALAGCGVVGGGLVRLLHESAPAIAARFGVRFELTRVLVRDVLRDRQLPLEQGLFTNELDSFLRHDADVVIEAVGGEEPARTIACTALKRGKKLITANKELVAAHGSTLSTLALENDTGLDFGASVGGSAPVISTLRDLVGASTPLSVRGILNGTSNYVISLLERGASLDSALASARERGLAEADCSRDLDGSDAAAKLAIIGWIAFGIRPSDLNTRRTSLIPGLERLVGLAAILESRLRFIAECTQVGDHCVAAAAEPVIVDSLSSFGRTSLEENRVEVDLGWGLPLSVSGPGAGGRPTAAALLSDLLRFESPPNDRGPGAAQFFSVSDPRSHRWLIAAKQDAASLQRSVNAAGIGVERVVTDFGGAAVITAPATWEWALSLVAALEATHAEPCIARYERERETEVLQ